MCGGRKWGGVREQAKGRSGQDASSCASTAVSGCKTCSSERARQGQRGKKDRKGKADNPGLVPFNLRFYTPRCFLKIVIETI